MLQSARNKWPIKLFIEGTSKPVAPRSPTLRRLFLFGLLSIIPLTVALAQSATAEAINGNSAVNAPSSDSSGIRPDHIWTTDYVDLLWNDTGAVLTAPVHWNEDDLVAVGFSTVAIGAAASLDKTIKDNVQAHRTAGEDRFFKQYENFGSTWSFGVIGAFEVWGEIAGDTIAKNTAMDALTASIIGPGLIGTSVKYAAGRVRPNTATRTFEFKPFSGNQSFPSGHSAQAFAVATAIAENYPSWWVQTLCYGGAGLVGYARIEQNAHYTSDVVAGAVLGWSVARAVVHRHQAKPSSTKITLTPYLSGNGGGLVVQAVY